MAKKNQQKAPVPPPAVKLVLTSEEKKQVILSTNVTKASPLVKVINFNTSSFILPIVKPDSKTELKKMNKAQKKAYLDQLAIEKKKEEEERLMNEATQRRAEYKEMINKLKIKDDEEQEVRDLILKNIVVQFQESTALKDQYENSLQEAEKWRTYMRTDESPDPRQPPELTSSLYRWGMENAIDQKFILAKMRDSQIHPLMNTLNEVIKVKYNFTDRQIGIFKEVKYELFEEAMRALERSSFRWATIPAPKAPPIPERFSYKVNQHDLAIWLLPSGPPKMIKPNEPPSDPVEIAYEDLGLVLTLPCGYRWHGVAVRVLRFRLDVLSPTNPAYWDPSPPATTDGSDLYEFTKFQHENIIILREQQARDRANFYAEIQSRIEQHAKMAEDRVAAKNMEQIDVFQLKIADPEPVPLPREQLFINEETAAKEYLENLRVTVEEDEIDLRKYRLLGGILYLQLLRQPPRPKIMDREITLTFMEAEEKMYEIDFHEDYTPPPVPEAGVVRAPEEIEAEIRQQEAALAKLILLNLNLTDTVLWLEPPVVCGWDYNRKTWVTNDIHDVKYNEDKFTLAFRTGLLRPMAFATPKYSNLPYQGWEMKPNALNTGTIVTIMGAIIVTEFDVTSEGIAIKSIQNGATKALQNMVGKVFPLKELIQLFQEGGVDFFPTEDSPLVIDGTCNKIPVLENHLYHCMAHTCTSYNYSWSRWNASAGRSTVVLQYREYLFSDIETLEIIHVTPEQASVVKSTEVSAEYSSEPIENLDFYPDLYSLLAGIGSKDAKDILTNIPWELVEYVRELLWAMRPCSYS